MNKESGTVDSREVLEYIRTICEDSIISDHTLEVCNRAIDLALKRIDDYGLLKTQLEIAEQTIKLNEWVDVRDRLPSESGLYICTSANQKKIGTCFYGVGRDKKLQWEDDRQDIIAWKPLPQPYERKE